MPASSIFLAFHDPAGACVYLELTPKISSPFYLPLEVIGNDLQPLHTAPDKKNFVQLDLDQTFVALSTYGDAICSLLSKGHELPVPISNEQKVKLFLLRDQDQFRTAAGRWSIQWDGENGTISNSMRPPAITGSPDIDRLGIEIHLDTAAIRNFEEKPTDIVAKDVSSNLESRTDVVTTASKIPSKEPQHFYKHKALKDNSPEDRNGSSEETHETTCISFTAPRIVARDQSLKESTMMSEHSQAATCMSMEGSRHVETIELPEPIDIPQENVSMFIPINLKRKRPSPEDPRKRRRPLQESADANNIVESEVESCASIANSPASRTRSHDSQTPTNVRRTFSKPDHQYRGAAPVVLFSSDTTVSTQPQTMQTFESLGGRVANSIREANVYCILESQMKKTRNFLVAIAEGKFVVSEQWIAETHRCGYFPDPVDFLARNKEKEQEWDFSLAEAVARGQEGLKHLLADTLVYLTPRLTQELGSRTQDLAHLGRVLGAKRVQYSLPSDNPKQGKANRLFLGIANDPHAAEVGRLGGTLYSKDLLTQAALKGRLNLESKDLLLETPIKQERDDSA